MTKIETLNWPTSEPIRSCETVCHLSSTPASSGNIQIIKGSSLILTLFYRLSFAHSLILLINRPIFFAPIFDKIGFEKKTSKKSSNKKTNLKQQNVWRRWAAFRAKEVDPLFWRSHRHYILCRTLGLWSRPRRRWRNGSFRDSFSHDFFDTF